MKYFIEDQNIALMKESFFSYRKKINSENDQIISIIDDELSTKADLIRAQKKLLKLEGTYRTTYKKWDMPPVTLETVFLPKYSL